VYWDCQYPTFEACYHLGNILAGNRGFCNLNPWPGPSQVVPYRHPKRTHNTDKGRWPIQSLASVVREWSCIPPMKLSEEDFKDELEKRLSELFVKLHGRHPKSREEWLSFASKHASAVVTTLRSEDELRAAGVNPDVKH
jgi:hypothetical protein